MKKRKPHFQNRQKRFCCSVETGNQWWSSCSASPEKKNRRCTKRGTRLREKQLKKQMDSKRKQEGVGLNAQRNSQDECKGQMQRWSSLLCWDWVFFRSISWGSQSGVNPQKCLARTGYKLNAKVKCLKISLYFCLGNLIFLQLWSNCGYWKSIKALYSSSFNFLIYGLF